MAAGDSKSVDGLTQSDTKRMRKYNTAWGVIYIPLTVVEELGGPNVVRFTIENIDDGSKV